MDEDLDGIANTTALVQDMLKEVVKANDNRKQQQQEQNDNRKRKDSSTGVSSNDNNERLRAGDKGGNRTSSSNSNGSKLPKPVRVCCMYLCVLIMTYMVLRYFLHIHANIIKHD